MNYRYNKTWNKFYMLLNFIFFIFVANLSLFDCSKNHKYQGN